MSFEPDVSGERLDNSRILTRIDKISRQVTLIVIVRGYLEDIELEIEFTFYCREENAMKQELQKIFCCLPVSNAPTERTFSALKRLKTYLRNTTAEERLNGLAHMNIHKEVNFTANEVLLEFCKKNSSARF